MSTAEHGEDAVLRDDGDPVSTANMPTPWPPPLVEDVEVCFCGHRLFDHDEYGPCSACPPGGCSAWAGCLVIGGRGRG